MIQILATLILLSILTTGCGTGLGVPQPPTIEIYLHFKDQDLALCSRTDGVNCASIPIAQTDKFFMLKPRDWKAINDYIDLLILSISDPGLKSKLILEKQNIQNTLRQ